MLSLLSPPTSVFATSTPLLLLSSLSSLLLLFLLALLLSLSLLLLYIFLLYAFFTDDYGIPTVPGRHWLKGHMGVIGEPSQFYTVLTSWAHSMLCPAFNFYLPGFNRKHVALCTFSSIAELHSLRPFKVRRLDVNLSIPELAPGLFAAEGEEWKKERKMVAPAFNHGNISR